MVTLSVTLRVTFLVINVLLTIPVNCQTVSSTENVSTDAEILIEPILEASATTNAPFLIRKVTRAPIVMDPTMQPTSKPNILNSFETMHKKSRAMIDKIVKEALPHIIRSEASRNMTDLCKSSMFKFIMALRKMDNWPLQMLDASGKIPLGLLRGTRASFGDYDQCVDVVVGAARGTVVQDGDNFVGQYCAVDVRPHPVDDSDREKLNHIVRTFAGTREVVQDLKRINPVKFLNNIHVRVGICIPSSCSLEDVRAVTAEISKMFMVKVNTKWCEVKKTELIPETRHFLAGSYVFPLMTLTVLATIIDGIPRLFRSFKKSTEPEKQKPVEKSKFRKLVDAFSAVNNGKKILNTATTDPAMAALHGIRFFSMTWIIFGHTYSFGHYLQISGIFKAKDIQKDFLFQAILNASFSVDSFFTISGILISYSALKNLEENKGKFSLLKYYFHRYIRTAPSFMMVTSLMMMGPLVGSGPVWNDTLDPFVNNCRKRWWANALFISYLWREKDICLPYGWYLSTDMTFYLISPAFVILYFKRPKLGMALTMFAILISIMSVTAITVLYNQPPVPLFTSSSYTIDDYINLIFFKPYSHLAPYCVGLAVGFFLYKKKDITIMSSSTQFSGWILSAGSCLALIYGVYGWNTGRQPQLIETVLYAGSCRTIWALGISWMVVACATGYGGAINTFLSWKAFVPLSRMTFMAYLLHPLLMYCFMANLRTTVPFGHYFFVWLFFAHLLSAYGVAFVLSMIYEAPFINLERWYNNSKKVHKRSVVTILPAALKRFETTLDLSCNRSGKDDSCNGSSNANGTKDIKHSKKEPSMESISLSDESIPEAVRSTNLPQCFTCACATGNDNKSFVCHL